MKNTTTQLGDAQAIVIQMEEMAGNAVRLESQNGVPLQIVKDGYQVKEREELLPRPLRREGTTVLLDLPSFNEYFNRFKSDASLIYADTSGFPNTIPTFSGVFNANESGPSGLAGWADHKCQYQPTFSVEWNRWMKNNKASLTQDAFLEHLSDNLPVVIVPAANEVLALVENLRGSVDVRFDKAVNLFNGKMKLHYSEDVKLTGGNATTKEADMEVPSELICAIAPFEFGDIYQVRNRIRYRVQNRQLFFSYEVMDAHKILMDAVNSMITKVKEATSQSVFNGKA